MKKSVLLNISGICFAIAGLVNLFMLGVFNENFLRIVACLLISLAVLLPKKSLLVLGSGIGLVMPIWSLYYVYPYILSDDIDILEWLPLVCLPFIFWGTLFISGLVRKAKILVFVSCVSNLILFVYLKPENVFAIIYYILLIVATLMFGLGFELWKNNVSTE